MIQHAYLILEDDSRIRIDYIEAWNYEIYREGASYKFTFLMISGNRIVTYTGDYKKKEIIDTLDNYSIK